MPLREVPNQIDRGSKLTTSQTLQVLFGCVAGISAKNSALAANVSQNTVSAIAARYRAKLRSSQALRQSAFELFYEGKFMSREMYVQLIEFPDGLPARYFKLAGDCAYRCPGDFALKKQDLTRFLIRGERRHLNIRQTQRFMDALPLSANLVLRGACSSCPVRNVGAFRRPLFFIAYRVYLSQRNLKEDQFEKYFLQFAIVYCLFHLALNRIGLEFGLDEIILPPENEWPQIMESYKQAHRHHAELLAGYMASVLVESPLNS